MDFTNLKNFMNHLTGWRIPGNSVSVCIDGKEVFSYSSGFADVENEEPMTEKKLLYIYSCSKVATVTAALQLYEKSFFSLDTPLYEFFPEYRNMYIKNPDGSILKAKNHITMRHLFTMTAGLTYKTDTPSFAKAEAITDGKMNTLTVIKCLAEDPISFEPGTAWQYSLCHDVLAGVVEVISGKKFSEYMKENIFLPLEMTDSCYHPENVINKMAEEYKFRNSNEEDIGKLQITSSDKNRDSGVLENVKKTNVDIFGSKYDSGGAGIITSVNEYSRFCNALANAGIGHTGEKILSQGTIDLMRENQLITPELMKNFNWEQLRGYGYGLGVRTLTDKASGNSLSNKGEFGWGGAAGSTVLIDPAVRLSMFYSHHMLNPQESYYQPRLRNALYSCL